MNPGNRLETGSADPGRSPRRLGLRIRIVLAFVLFGLLLSSGFAGVAYLSMDDFEAIVVRQLLQSETEQLIELQRADPDNPLPSSQRMYARASPLAASKTLPARLRTLGPGIHVLDEDGEHETYVDVRDDGSRRFFYFIELGAIAEREAFVQWLLLTIVVAGTLVSGGLGLLFAGYLVSPVQRLSQWVDAAVPEHPAGTLALRFADDEVGALAAAFDRYQRRLESFLRREQEFTADASHELRSPLSVLKAGLDLLAEDAGVGPAGRRALVRMRRRAAELGGLLDLLLYLARDESSPGHDAQPVLLLPIWQRLVADRETPAGSIAVELGGDDKATVVAPAHICHVAFEHLLSRAEDQAAAQVLRIDVDARGIRIGPLASVPENADGSRSERSDERLGLTLVARLCDRLQWKLGFSKEHSALVLEFSNTTPATTPANDRESATSLHRPRPA